MIIQVTMDDSYDKLNKAVKELRESSMRLEHAKKEVNSADTAQRNAEIRYKEAVEAFNLATLIAAGKDKVPNDYNP